MWALSASVLSLLLLAAASCDIDSGSSSCASYTQLCMKNGTETDKSRYCSCQSIRATCYRFQGCDEGNITALTGKCITQGCSADQCAPWLTSTTIVTDTCDAVALTACGNTLTSCLENNSSSPTMTCECSGAYVGCLKNAECPAATIAAVIAACVESGCTSAECDA